MTASDTPETDAVLNDPYWGAPTFPVETLTTHARKLERDRDRLAALLREMLDANNGDSVCHYDHNGLCQTHWLHERPCLVERAQQALSRAGE